MFSLGLTGVTVRLGIGLVPVSVRDEPVEVRTQSVKTGQNLKGKASTVGLDVGHRPARQSYFYRQFWLSPTAAHTKLPDPFP